MRAGLDPRRAGEVLKLLFPDGLAFLKLPYIAEHAESQRRVDVIEERKLGATIDGLAGRELLAAVQGARHSHGEGLGITKAGAARQAVPALDEPLRKLTAAIGAYNAWRCASSGEIRAPRARGPDRR